MRDFDKERKAIYRKMFWDKVLYGLSMSACVAMFIFLLGFGASLGQ